MPIQIQREETCYSCKKFKICYFQHSLSDSIRSFKLLCSDLVEAKNTGKSKTTADIYSTVAEACTEYSKRQTEG